MNELQVGDYSFVRSGPSIQIWDRDGDLFLVLPTFPLEERACLAVLAAHRMGRQTGELSGRQKLQADLSELLGLT